jgi:hypothetical protein
MKPQVLQVKGDEGGGTADEGLSSTMPPSHRTQIRVQELTDCLFIITGAICRTGCNYHVKTRAYHLTK